MVAVVQVDESRSYLVFAQGDAPYLDVAALAHQARRFFEATVEPTPPATADERYTVTTRLAVVADAGRGGARHCFARSAGPLDWAAAERAEARTGFAGLSLLARRCETLWVVEAEASNDAIALRIAAVLASLFLGPILAPGGDELFGVRTARIKLERTTGAPYR
jgi:hypothetical protein